MIPSIDVLGPGTGWLAGALIKVTLLLIAAAIITVALRRASAAARHLVWSAAVVTVLAVPVMTALLPWRLPVIRAAAPAAGPPQQVAVLPADPATEVPLAGPASPPATPGAFPVAPGPAVTAVTAPTALAALTAVWLTGALLLLLRLAVGAGFLARVIRRATPLASPDWTRPLLEAADRLELSRAPRLLMSGRLPMPYATGFLRPTIVVPESAQEWDDRRRRAVLCHELAHLRRMDLMLNGVSQVACALWWFHPLVWVAARKLRTESERACDDLVLGVGTRASEYADHLLHIVCGALRARTPAVALPMAQRHEFEGRMLAILDRDARRDQPSRRHAIVLSALAIGVVLPVAALGIGTARAPAENPPPAATEAQLDEQSGAAGKGAGRPQSAPDSGAPVEVAAPSHPPAAPVANAAEGTPQDTTTPRVVAALIGALQDPVSEVRRGAVIALGRREAPSAVHALSARLIEDAAEGVREAAAWALGQIESREATVALGEAAGRDSSEEVRGTAVWALGQIEDPRSVPVLVAILADPSARVRGRAAWALGTIGARPAPGALLTALQDASPEVRYRAAWALGQIQDTSAVPALTVAFDDPDPDVRKAAFWAAAQMPGEGAQPALLKALEHEDPEIRTMAARALGGSHSDPWPWPWPWPR